MNITKTHNETNVFIVYHYIHYFVQTSFVIFNLQILLLLLILYLITHLSMYF